ncbi:MAG: aminotransferase class V-fold PLP-dependent enzyme [Acidobacteriaceae bacterium]
MPESSLDIAHLRADTTGCAGRIFFNNAGASLPPRPVVERVIEHLRLEERIGGYEAADAMEAELAGVYGTVATLLNAHPEEIALTESATRAWDMAFYALPLRAGDRILTAQNEYSSNYIAFLQVTRRTGAVVEVIPGDGDGAIDLGALEASLERDHRARLIALTHVATNNGLVQPAADVGRLARRFGVPFLLDACQSAGQLPLDVEALGCDLLSATSRKYLRGPRGTGFLYVRRSLLPQLEPPLLDMHAAEWTTRESYRMRDDAKRFEAWESSAACRLGMGRAVEYALDLGLERIAARVQQVAAELRAQLHETPGITVQDRGRVQCGIVTFTHAQHSPFSILEKLAAQQILVRISPRNATLLDMEQRGLDAVVRASVHYYNTSEEIGRFCAAMRAL